MVIIHTSDDILRVLRERPEWKAEVRREILTEELMNLPARFDRFAATTEQFMADTEQSNEDQRQFNEEQRRFSEDQRQINEEQRRFNEDQRQFNDHAGPAGRMEFWQWTADVQWWFVNMWHSVKYVEASLVDLAEKRCP